jgi:trimeric autotransporter adhesin
LKNKLHSIAIGLALCFCSNVADAQYIARLAGNYIPGHTGDTAQAINASLRAPSSICMDEFSNLYIADGGPFGIKNDACIRKIDAVTGIITTIAGMVDSPVNATNVRDSIPAVQAHLKGVAAICFDKNKNLLIADGYSTIRMIDMSTGVITTIAGTRDVAGYAGDGGPATAALLNGPVDIAVDNANNIYVAEKNNHIIRRIFATTGTIQTVAGRGAMGYSGDGGSALMAKLNSPRGVYVNNSGTLFIADYNNNRVRSVTNTGTINTVAGSAAGYYGDGGPAGLALLNQPVRLTMDGLGNMYITDAANQRIRKIDASGIISTYAGNGENFTGPDSIGDGRLATKASIAAYGLCVDECNNLLMGSVGCQIRGIAPTPVKGTLCNLFIVGVNDAPLATAADLSLYPNPNNGTFTLNLSTGANQPITVSVTDITGRQVFKTNGLSDKKMELNLNAGAGMYFVHVATTTGTITRKIVVQ